MIGCAGSRSGRAELSGTNWIACNAGLDPDDWKPMAGIGPGVREIRVRDATGAYRVFYIASFAEAVYVLHVFEKKTQRTPGRDLAIAQSRLRELKHGGYHEETTFC